MLLTLFRSLLLTGIAGFIAPTFFIGVLVAIAFLIGFVPGFSDTSAINLTRLFHFLKVFGSGSPIQGIAVLGIVGSTVGMLFDTYALLSPFKPMR